jgi:large-conductance mechanosensitive channel
MILSTYIIMDLMNPNSFRDKFSKFVVENGVVGAAAGVSIAIASNDMITSLVGDILIPLVYLLLIRINANATKFLPHKTKLDVIKFIQKFVSLIFVTVISFLFIQYFFNNFLGVRNKPANAEKDKEKESFTMPYSY